ncbi:MAG TPA: 3-oxoacyl-ACP reductase family protein [Candidatus Binataceae bacterium]|nr:3-oxoacyl-ACP reductase family protein [Candidatus Binataceae bacterium]
MAFKGLADKVAIVTGAGQGIGRAYAHRFAQEGCSVVVAEINAEKGKSVVGEVQSAGGKALFVAADVSDESSCQAMAKAAADKFGRIDILVNNAAIFSTIKMKPFWELTEAEWDQLMNVNLKGTWLASKAVLPAMRKQGGGSIINISSAAYLLGRPNYIHYVASKAGVLGITRSMAREVGEFGIRVNAITPGPVYTEIPRGTVTPEQKEAMLKAQCIKRHQGPEDLVGIVAFLASDDAGFITGQTFNVEGGLTHL